MRIGQRHKDLLDLGADLFLVAIDEGRDLLVEHVVDELIDPSVSHNTANVRGYTAQADGATELVDLDGAKDEGHLVLELALNRQILQAEGQWARALVAHRQSQFLQQIHKGVGVQIVGTGLQLWEVEVELDLLAKGVADLHLLDLHAFQAIETEAQELQQGTKDDY